MMFTDMASESCRSFIETVDARKFWQDKRFNGIDIIRTSSASLTYLCCDGL